jgi:hypothetical protein
MSYSERNKYFNEKYNKKELIAILIHLPHIINLYDGNKVVTFSVNRKHFYKIPSREIYYLFHRFFNYLLKRFNSKESLTILIHNLGSYDGYFIFKFLLMYLKEFKQFKALIGKDNEFITIKYKNIKFIDSCRLFGKLSLNDLCKLFKVEGKFVSKPEWWKEDILRNEKEYQKLLEYSK